MTFLMNVCKILFRCFIYVQQILKYKVVDSGYYTLVISLYFCCYRNNWRAKCWYFVYYITKAKNRSWHCLAKLETHLKCFQLLIKQQKTANKTKYAQNSASNFCLLVGLSESMIISPKFFPSMYFRLARSVRSFK